MKLQTPQCAAGALIWPARTATDSTIDKQPTPTRDRHPVSGTDRPLSAHRRRPPARAASPARRKHTASGEDAGVGGLRPKRARIADVDG